MQIFLKKFFVVIMPSKGEIIGLLECVAKYCRDMQAMELS